jgi:hypothetical protein
MFPPRHLATQRAMPANLRENAPGAFVVGIANLGQLSAQLPNTPFAASLRPNFRVHDLD